MIRSLLRALFRPGIISNIPGGVVPDNVGAWGLFGFMSNANSYAASMASYATAASTPINANDVERGVIQLNAGAAAGFTIQLPSTANLLTAFGPTIPLDGGFFKPLFFSNQSGQTGTVTAGDAMTSVVGSALVFASTARLMMLRVLGSTVQISSVGALSL